VGCAAEPVKLEGLSDIIDVTAGGFNTCVVTAEALPRCWGPNRMGQLGSGDYRPSARPVPVKTFERAAGISAGILHMCMTNPEGNIYCWGNNSMGQLGSPPVKTSDASVAPHSALPARVERLAGARSVSCGGTHSCAVLNDGSAVCWGGNEQGKLGNGTRTNSSYPVKVRAISAAGGGLGGAR
jgi:alpha-tubulin suppressor-like RCC1 family protein